MPRRGKQLEALTHKLESLINKNPNMEIKSPAFLEDKVTGEMREHDVLLTLKQNHHDFVTAIECKDWSSKVGTPTVESFAEKCKDTGVQRGIIVSSKGFSKPAIKKAKMKDIYCFSLNEVDSFDWCEARHYTFVSRELTHINLEINFSQQLLESECELFFKGASLSKEFLNAIGVNCIEALKVDKEIKGEISRTLVASNPQDFTAKKDGEVYLAAQVIINISFTQHLDHIPLQFIEYNDVSKDGAICQAFFTKNDPALKGSIALVKKEGAEFMQLSYIPATSPEE